MVNVASTAEISGMFPENIFLQYPFFISDKKLLNFKIIKNYHLRGNVCYNEPGNGSQFPDGLGGNNTVARKGRIPLFRGYQL